MSIVRVVHGKSIRSVENALGPTKRTRDVEKIGGLTDEVVSLQLNRNESFKNDPPCLPRISSSALAADDRAYSFYSNTHTEKI